MEKYLGNRQISEYMTPISQFVAPYDTAQTARELLARNKLSCLPVLCQDKPIGILSQRTLLYLHAFLELKLDQICAKDIMDYEFHIECMTETLSRVSQKMLDKGCDTTVILSARKEAVGVFTAFDALDILCTLSRSDNAVESYTKNPYVF